MVCVSVVKMPLQKPTPHIRVPGFGSQFFQFQIPVNVYLERQQMIAHVFGSLPPMQEIWIEFQALCSSLPQQHLL